MKQISSFILLSLATLALFLFACDKTRSKVVSHDLKPIVHTQKQEETIFGGVLVNGAADLFSQKNPYKTDKIDGLLVRDVEVQAQVIPQDKGKVNVEISWSFQFPKRFKEMERASVKWNLFFDEEGKTEVAKAHFADYGHLLKHTLILADEPTRYTYKDLAMGKVYYFYVSSELIGLLLQTGPEGGQVHLERLHAKITVDLR